MITIVDYNGGNLRSVKRACDAIGIVSRLTQDPALVRAAERIIFPGVGAAKSAMQTLREQGLDLAVRAAFHAGVPILGICVGAQVILDRSEEGETEALGLIPGVTRRFQRREQAMKVPHMGWNQVRVLRQHPLLSDIGPADTFYFVHSYYPQPAAPEHAFASCDYFGAFCCALGRDNLFATQFHPEKSGVVGLELLRRFAAWDGTQAGVARPQQATTAPAGDAGKEPLC